VLDTLAYIHHETDCWLEITTLLIPGQNDSDAEINGAGHLGRRELGPRRAAALHRLPPRLEDDRPAADAAGT
jgi:pyruvate-formate lyase-activating enzyme